MPRMQASYGALIQGQEDEIIYGDPAVQGNAGVREENKLWQTFLGHKGYDLGCWCVDGDFGGATKSATKAFQAEQGVPVSPQGYVLYSTLDAASRLGFGTTLLTTPLDSAERKIACPGNPCRSNSVTKTDSVDVVKTRGKIGEVAAVVMTPRGLAIGVSITALLVGGVLLARGQRG